MSGIIDKRIAVIKRDMDTVENRYNGDFDTLPDHPVVTWADYQLFYSISKLVDCIIDLQSQIDELRMAGQSEPGPGGGQCESMADGQTCSQAESTATTPTAAETKYVPEDEEWHRGRNK